MIYNISIVILNYLNYKDTIDCVNSILEVKYRINKIVIVDNGSTNKSYDILVDEFKDKSELVYIISAERNFGFAKGYNIGIDYIRKYIKSDFIMIVNNDTIFYDKEILDILLSKYRIGIGAIGPKIIGKDGRNQNPVLIRLRRKRIERDINYMININSKKTRNFDKQNIFICNIKYIIKKVLYHDIVLHGACIILTPDYFKYYSHLYPKTFLYYEENILKVLLNKVGLKMKYVNKTKIYHKEDQSSNLAFNNDSEIINQYALDSANLCLKLYDKSYEEIIEEDFN